MKIQNKFNKLQPSSYNRFIFNNCGFRTVKHGSITGVVADPNGAVVANATVTITNDGTNEKRTIQTDSDGRFEFPSLPTGIYKVSAKG